MPKWSVIEKEVSHLSQSEGELTADYYLEYSKVREKCPCNCKNAARITYQEGKHWCKDIA